MSEASSANGRLGATASAPAACFRGGEEAWPACVGPRVSSGGLQRACRLPSKHTSCPLLRGVPDGGPPAPPGGGLDRVLDGLYICSGAAAARRPDLAAVNVTHVVNAAPSVELCWHEPHLQYLVVDVLDGPNEPIGRHFARVNAFVAAARAAGGTVLVHCHGGVSRAATLVLAFLIGREGLCFDAALAALRQARPVVSPNSGFLAQLRAFEARLLAGLPECPASCDADCRRLGPDTPEADMEDVEALTAPSRCSPECSREHCWTTAKGGVEPPPARSISAAARFAGSATL